MSRSVLGPTSVALGSVLAARACGIGIIFVAPFALGSNAPKWPIVLARAESLMTCVLVLCVSRLGDAESVKILPLPGGPRSDLDDPFTGTDADFDEFVHRRGCTHRS